MLALMDFQLLMFLKGLLTTFKTAYILFLLIFMLAFKMFLQVWFCVEFLITATSSTTEKLYKQNINQGNRSFKTIKAIAKYSIKQSLTTSREVSHSIRPLRFDVLSTQEDTFHVRPLKLSIRHQTAFVPGAEGRWKTLVPRAQTLLSLTSCFTVV